MNNNNTVIPGLNSPAQPVRPTGAAFPNQPVFVPNPQATVIPNVSPIAPAVQAKPNGQIFGFLFSVSKTNAGEYWPLMLGANTLGRGSKNSIDLQEATVSESHASIHVISRANRLIVYIKDDQSKTGTLLNGELLRGEADLTSGDIITIGERYELYVVLINAFELGLKVNPEFATPSCVMPPIPKAPFVGNPQMQAPTVPPVPPVSPVPPVHNRPVNHSTVVEGQSGPVPMGGHTVIMGGPKK